MYLVTISKEYLIVTVKSYSVEKANEFAKKALERMHKEGLPPSPENYELWYVYYSGANADVTRAIDILISNDQAITEERCEELHQRFLSEKSESEQVRKAGDKIQSTIKEVKNVVTNVKDATSKYNTTLTGISGQLSGDLPKEDLEKILSDVLSNTQEMMDHNLLLEEKLMQSSHEMLALQRDLERVRREALTDSLTSLANRKSFDSEIIRIMQEALEQEWTFSLIMVDIDHFKTFNDNFGHQVGDQVLKLVAKTLTDGVKGRDVAARYGGEEFAILLPETNLQGGLRVSENLRQAVASKEVVNRNTGEKLGRITLSGGVAEYVPGEKPEDLIERADAALYTAKHNGRNQIATAPVSNQKKNAG